MATNPVSPFLLPKTSPGSADGIKFRGPYPRVVQVDFSQSDLVCLYLDAVGPDGAGSGAAGEEAVSDGSSPAGYPPGTSPRTLRGIAAALELERETTTERIRLLSTLDELEAEGLVISEPAPDGGTDRWRYRLTESGSRHARELRERVEGTTVTVTNGRTEEVAIEEFDRYFDGFPVVRALTRFTDGGTIRLHEVGGPFVDRDAERRALHETLSTVTDRGSRTVIVSGEAGVGKTALVERFLSDAREEGFAVATGRCRRSGDPPYGPMVDAFRSLPDPDELVDPLRAATGEAAADPAALEAERAVRFEAVADALRERVRDRPVVLFLDDLHWAGTGTRGLFAHLARSITEWIYPVLFVATYRRETAAVDHDFDGVLADLVAEDRTDHLELGPLPEPDGHGLVAWLTDRPNLPDELLSSLRERSGGNPLYLRETVRQLLDAGTLDADDPADPSDLPVPEDLVSVVESRVATLPDRTRRVLEAAAVAGEPAAPELVAAVVGEPEAAVNDHLDVLVAAGLLRRTEDGVAFAGGVVRDAVVDTLDPGRRRDLHATTAGVIEATVPEEVDARAGRIASHYERSGRPSEAIGWYRRAGEHAASSYAHAEAVDAYESALSLARDVGAESTVLALLERMADAHERLGNFDAALDAYAEVLDGADDLPTRQRMYRKRAAAHQDRGEAERVVELAEAGLELTGCEDGDAPGEGDPVEVAKLHDCRGWGLLQTGDVEAAIDALERQRAIGEQLGDEALVGEALNSLGGAELRRWNQDAAEDYLTAAAERRRGTDDRALAGTLNNLGVLYRRTGEFDAANEAVREGLAIVDEVGDVNLREALLTNMGVLAESRGQRDEALEYFEEALSLARRAGMKDSVAILEENLAGIRRKKGDLERARDHQRRALSVTREIDDREGIATAHSNLGLLALEAGETERAKSEFQSALSVAREIGVDQRVARIRTHLGRVARQEGDPERALRHHRAAVEVAEAGASRELSVEAEAELAHSLAAAGDLADAEERCRNALDGTADLDAPDRTAHARVSAGVVASLRDDHGAALEHLRAAVEIARDAGDRPTECRALVELARAARRSGEQQEACDRARECRSVTGDSGMELYRAAAEDLLSGVE